MPLGPSLATLRDLLDLFADRIAAGDEITYTDDSGTWILRGRDAHPPTERGRPCPTTR